MSTDEKYMQRCIQLALLGKGNVAPNPMVGAVIVHNDKIIGEGYHQKYGEAHAEVNAVNSVKDPTLLPEATIYVSLEPCAHHGKTPPCADLLVHHKFKRAVIGSTDSFEQVSGKGIERLRNAGIEVTVGVLEKECLALNKHFFTFHEKKRPYVFLKWAQTSNGLIDNGEHESGTVTWISVPEVQTRVHQWRTEYMAILVGKNTVERDNPSLTVRKVAGKNPIRIVLDSSCSLNPEHAIFNNEAPTIVLNIVKADRSGLIEYVKLPDMSPKSVLDALYELDIQSVLVEGGAQTLQSFIDSNLWDEACVITGQTTFTNGTKAPVINQPVSETEVVFGDQLNFYRNR